MKTCDVAVIGVGIMGSAALYHLQKKGVDAVGFDPLAVGDEHTSSHGSCRVFRKVNFESPIYTDLGERAFKLWKDLETAAGVTLLEPSAVLEACSPDKHMVRASREAAGRHVPGPTNGAEANALYPAFNLPDDWEVVVHDDGGILSADKAWGAYRSACKEHIVDEAARFEPTPDGIVVTASGGGEYLAKQVIVTPGPWIADLIPDLATHVAVTRQVVGWFAPKDHRTTGYPAMPIFILNGPHGAVYGFPDFEGSGVKAACHDHGPEVHPDQADHHTVGEGLDPVKRTIEDFIPGVSTSVVDSDVCLYTNTKKGDVDQSKDEEFVVDRLPTDRRIIVASVCSGHGFKFASVIGEILCDMVVNDADCPVKEFRLGRFGSFRG